MASADGRVFWQATQVPLLPLPSTSSPPSNPPERLKEDDSAPADAPDGAVVSTGVIRAAKLVSQVGHSRAKPQRRTRRGAAPSAVGSRKGGGSVSTLHASSSPRRRLHGPSKPRSPLLSNASSSSRPSLSSLHAFLDREARKRQKPGAWPSDAAGDTPATARKVGTPATPIPTFTSPSSTKRLHDENELGLSAAAAIIVQDSPPRRVPLKERMLNGSNDAHGCDQSYLAPTATFSRDRRQPVRNSDTAIPLLKVPARAERQTTMGDFAKVHKAAESSSSSNAPFKVPSLPVGRTRTAPVARLSARQKQSAMGADEHNPPAVRMGGARGASSSASIATLTRGWPAAETDAGGVGTSSKTSPYHAFSDAPVMRQSVERRTDKNDCGDDNEMKHPRKPTISVPDEFDEFDDKEMEDIMASLDVHLPKQGEGETSFSASGVDVQRPTAAERTMDDNEIETETQLPRARPYKRPRRALRLLDSQSPSKPTAGATNSDRSTIPPSSLSSCRRLGLSRPRPKNLSAKQRAQVRSIAAAFIDRDAAVEEEGGNGNGEDEGDDVEETPSQLAAVADGFIVPDDYATQHPDNLRGRASGKEGKGGEGRKRKFNERAMYAMSLLSQVPSFVQGERQGGEDESAESLEAALRDLGPAMRGRQLLGRLAFEFGWEERPVFGSASRVPRGSGSDGEEEDKDEGEEELDPSCNLADHEGLETCSDSDWRLTQREGKAVREQKAKARQTLDEFRKARRY